MDLAKLITVLQSAKEGSEYLDYAVQRVLFGMAKPVPEYSRSIDAAMRLVPDGWTIHRLSQLSDCHGGFGGWVGDLYRASDAMIPYPSEGTTTTASLALCLAALRVRYGELISRSERTQDEDRPLQRSGTN